MAAAMKMRLSAMLDEDLEAKASAEAAQDENLDASMNAYKPATIPEWMQVASVEDLRASLKALVTDVDDARSQVQALLEEERAHEAWVDQQEKQWTKAPEKAKDPEPEVAESAGTEKVPAAMSLQGAAKVMQAEVRYIPLRLAAGERTLLGILEGALYVSEYTDQVDVYHVGNKARRMALQIQQVCAILAGLVVANNFDVARRPLMERSFAENRHFFRGLFEIGRRYKILNPDKLRGSYGKLIHMLQDSVKSEVVRAIEFECVTSVQTVWTMCQAKAKGAELLRDPLLTVATREIYSEGKTREQVGVETLEKSEALAELKRRYAQKPPEGTAIKAQGDLAELLRSGNNRKPELEALLTEDNVETIVASVSDHFAFQRFNREPVERMIVYLKSCFDPSDGKEWSLEIGRGRGGSCLSHGHRTQYTFVLQSLLLWKEIMENMFALWQMTEEDLLDSDSSYRLCDTGQGLNRVQQAPRVSRMMHQILHKVQSEVGSWVGLSVVHLGDRDVPNALVFIDKYIQVPRILGPLVRTLDRIPEVYDSTPAIRALFDKEFGGAEVLRMSILQDFFQHGFDGSGDDGGSCIDGRLTSCWNWCSKVEKKKYFPAFLLTGFSGFDGGFETGLGS